MTNHTTTIKDPKLGNGLAAYKDLVPGEVIIQILEPHLIVVEKEALDRVCSYCLLESDLASLKRCAGCKIVRYCSPTCQKTDWKLIHKSECSVLAKLPAIPPTPVRALYQYLLRGKGVMDERSAGLEHHLDELKGDGKRWDEMVLQARGAVAFSRSPGSKLEMVTRLLCVMSTNAFRATLPDDTPIGLCYEPLLALANHSCTPNAFVLFNGRTISLTALNPIPKASQIFISYIDFTQPLDLRTQELQQRYFFTCTCAKCSSDLTPYQVFQTIPLSNHSKLDLLLPQEPLQTHATTLIPLIRALQSEISPLVEDISKVRPLIELSREKESARERFNFLTQMHTELLLYRQHEIFALSPYPMVLDEIYLAYIDAGKLSAALVSNHPVRVTRLFTIARLLKYISSLPQKDLSLSLPCVSNEVLADIDWIDAVHVVLVLVSELAPLSHGRDSVFVKQIHQELHEVEEVQKQQGKSGAAIQEWQAKGDVSKNGTIVAKSVFASLRSLAGFAFEVIEGVRI